MAGGTWPPAVLANRYVLGRSLGHGGMGSVWQAEDLTLKRSVAVKLIHLSSQADESSHARFIREAQAAAGLVHPNIVTVHDFGVDDGVAFMVMEYLPGPDLATLVRRSGPLPVDQALDYLEQAAAGLAAAHARGILHRDVKPANLMLTGFGTLKVLDFGIAALADHSQQLTATSQLIGTLSYLAPERSMGSPASVQSDLYAFGCVAVTLLTGTPPFEGTTGQILLKHLNQAPPRPSAHRAGVPASLDALIDSLLAKDPAQRPGAAEDVIRWISSCREAVSVSGSRGRESVAVPGPASPSEPAQSRTQAPVWGRPVEPSDETNSPTVRRASRPVTELQLPPVEEPVDSTVLRNFNDATAAPDASVAASLGNLPPAPARRTAAGRAWSLSDWLWVVTLGVVVAPTSIVAVLESTLDIGWAWLPLFYSAMTGPAIAAGVITQRVGATAAAGLPSIAAAWWFVTDQSFSSLSISLPLAISFGSAEVVRLLMAKRGHSMVAKATPALGAPIGLMAMVVGYQMTDWLPPMLLLIPWAYLVCGILPQVFAASLARARTRLRARRQVQSMTV